jgi:riboflavin kinase/FMN adenylyltransferase
MNTTKKIFALGFFDGVHLGHQALLAECVRLAREQNAQPAAITFDRHPQALFSAEVPALINTPADREALLRQYGIGYIHTLKVTKEVMSTDWRDFLTRLTECGAVGFVCGSDFRFGHKGQGNREKLRAFCGERGLICATVPEQTLDGIRVSSTHIRNLIEMGMMADAVKLLGHPYTLSGKVVPGYQLGRRMGVPTANLMLPKELAVPRFGVYACHCNVEGERYVAVTNIGTRPTVAGIGVTVEPWILDYNGDLYDWEITLEFHRFLRPEQKFTSLEALRQEILRNAEETRAYFQTVR